MRPRTFLFRMWDEYQDVIIYAFLRVKGCYYLCYKIGAIIGVIIIIYAIHIGKDIQLAVVP